MNSRVVLSYANNQPMLSRIVLPSLLALVVLLAPAAPIDIKAALTSKMSCSIRAPMDPCHGCPINSSQTNSSSACCSAQAPCFVSFANNGDDFAAGLRSQAFQAFVNDRFPVRSQRPPVPPPRCALS